MRLLISAYALLLSLWLGGIVWLMVGVQSLFSADRAVAVQAAPMLFRAFERYQVKLALACVLLAALIWRLVPAKWTRGLAVLTAVAASLAFASATFITPQVDALRSDQGASGAFKALHLVSMLLYSTEAVLLAVALGWMVSWITKALSALGRKGDLLR